MTQGKATTHDDVTPPPAGAAAPVVQPQNTTPEGAELATGADPAAASGYLASITENYSQFRAAGQIPWGNAVAFNPGDAVNADHPALEQWLDDGLVEPVPGAKASKGKGR